MGFLDRMRRAAWLLASHFACRRGATTAEYALILALVVVALIGTLGALRDALQGKLEQVIDQLRR